MCSVHINLVQPASGSVIFVVVPQLAAAICMQLESRKGSAQAGSHHPSIPHPHSTRFGMLAEGVHFCTGDHHISHGLRSKPGGQGQQMVRVASE